MTKRCTFCSIKVVKYIYSVKCRYRLARTTKKFDGLSFRFWRSSNKRFGQACKKPFDKTQPNEVQLFRYVVLYINCWLIIISQFKILIDRLFKMNTLFRLDRCRIGLGYAFDFRHYLDIFIKVWWTSIV